MRLFTNSILCAAVSTVVVAQHHYEGDHYYGTAAAPVANTQATVVAGHHYEGDHYYPDHYYGTVAAAPAANTPAPEPTTPTPEAAASPQTTAQRAPEAPSTREEAKGNYAYYTQVQGGETHTFSVEIQTRNEGASRFAAVGGAILAFAGLLL